MSKIKIALVVFILFFSIIIRLNNYSVYPQRGATSDEYTYSFLGVSLLKQHIPISWSTFSEYKNRSNLTINKIYFPIVYPYFDHPPLNGLLIGGWALLFGQDTFQKITLEVIRIMPIILSLISSAFLFLISFRLYGYKTAIWALLIFSTVTIFVMNMRIVVAENLLTVFYLSSIYLFIIFSKNINLKKIIILGTLAGLALLTKILGVTVFLSLLYLFLNEKIKPKFTIALCLTFIFFVLTLFAYAAYFDWSLFWRIQAEQGGRMIGPQTLSLLIFEPTIVNKVIYDGWYFLGFIALFFSFNDYKKNKLIIVPSIIYFLLLLTSLTKEGHSGWYLIPLYPFMSVSIANLLNESLKKINFSFFVFLLFIGMWQIKMLYENPFGLTSVQFRTLVFLLFAPLLISNLFENKKSFKILGNLLFYMFILGNVIITLNYIHPA
ncbi:MAG: glycosyltransferase family 39 protein [Candidatus Levybacteria bacterium]|nr:glycosyltransferase family 39 protein [Candidatus Levybacteria bacterium]